MATVEQEQDNAKGILLSTLGLVRGSRLYIHTERMLSNNRRTLRVWARGEESEHLWNIGYLIADLLGEQRAKNGVDMIHDCSMCEFGRNLTERVGIVLVQDKDAFTYQII